MYQGFALLVVANRLQVQHFLHRLQRLDLVVLVLIVPLIHARNAHHLLFVLTIQVQQIRVFRTDWLSFVVLVQLGYPGLSSKYVVDGKGVKLIKIEVVVNVL